MSVMTSKIRSRFSQPPWTVCKVGLLLPLVMLIASPVLTNAQGTIDFPEFAFSTNNGTLTLKKYNGTNATVVVPSTSYGLDVAEISGPPLGMFSDVFPYFVTSVSIPSSVTNVVGSAFTIGLGRLREITVDPNNTYYSSLGGVLFDKGLTSVIRFPLLGGPTYTVPISVTNIASGAFQVCLGLRNIYFQGDAPSTGEFAFGGANNATVYYLPGAYGWGPIFSDRPTALWTPKIQTDDTTFGVQTNQFGFNVAWAGGMVAVVEACTNLANPIWTPLQTNSLTADSLYYSDSEWTNYPARFYRVRWP